MAATEGGDPVPVAKVSIGPRAEPPGTCTQAAALVAKDVRTALRSPVACIASTLAPALLVFLMGITGLIQDDATPPAQATSFAAAVRAGCCEQIAPPCAASRPLFRAMRPERARPPPPVGSLREEGRRGLSLQARPSQL